MFMSTINKIRFSTENLLAVQEYLIQNCFDLNEVYFVKICVVDVLEVDVLGV